MLMEFDKIYPDTVSGVLELLRDETSVKLPASGVRVEPDSFDSGVWKVSLDPAYNEGCDTIVVYLAGYSDRLGRRRVINDWELGNSV